jgi:hypothetical protein
VILVILVILVNSFVRKMRLKMRFVENELQSVKKIPLIYYKNSFDGRLHLEFHIKLRRIMIVFEYNRCQNQQLTMFSCNRKNTEE